MNQYIALELLQVLFFERTVM